MTPIGTEKTPFSGTFDGNNHRIENLTITKNNKEQDEQVALFAHVAEGAVIENLGVVATKIDKLKRSQRHRALKLIQETLGLPAESPVLPFSSETREGLKELWQVIDDQI